MENKKLQMGQDVSALLENVFTEYLQNILECMQGSCSTIRLQPAELFGIEVQDILMLGETPTEKRRVYGVQPLDCTLRVEEDEGGYTLALA